MFPPAGLQEGSLQIYGMVEMVCDGMNRIFHNLLQVALISPRSGLNALNSDFLDSEVA